MQKAACCHKAHSSEINGNVTIGADLGMESYLHDCVIVSSTGDFSSSSLFISSSLSNDQLVFSDLVRLRLV